MGSQVLETLRLYRNRKFDSMRALQLGVPFGLFVLRQHPPFSNTMPAHAGAVAIFVSRAYAAIRQ